MSWTLPAARHRPSTLGLHNGQLRACPNKPNCVSSQAPAGSHHVEPLSYTGTRNDALKTLRQLLEADPKAEVITQQDNYIHAEFTAMVFIDDVEFSIPPSGNVIHLRSASRLGRSDMGANKRRVDKIRAAFAAAQ